MSLSWTQAGVQSLEDRNGGGALGVCSESRWWKWGRGGREKREPIEGECGDGGGEEQGKSVTGSLKEVTSKQKEVGNYGD